MNKPQLIFVYNADSGLFNTVTDWAHKIISPSTYQCELCALTYGNFTMKNEWKNFIQTLPAEVIFTYKNDFHKQHQQEVELPAVFLKKNHQLPLLIISKNEISHCNHLDELMNLISKKLCLYQSQSAGFE